MSSQAILKELRKKLEIDVSMLGEDDSPCVVTEWIPTGCLALDAIMGGGLPVGRMVEIYGKNSTGKSLIASQVAALTQREGGIVAYADTETAVSLDMMKVVGVDVDDMIYASPDTVEEVFTFFEEAITAKRKLDPDNFLFMVWDSVAATSSEAEMDNEYGKATMGGHARLISQGLRKITRLISKERACLLLLNQTREKIGVLFGDRVATFGGNAVSFHASIRIYLDVGKKIKVNTKKGSKIAGMETRAVVVKNKVSMPFREATLPIYFGHGIDDAGAAFHYLVNNGIMEQNGAWYRLPINGKKEKFQKAGWEEVFDAHYDEITDLILGSVDEYVQPSSEYETEEEGE